MQLNMVIINQPSGRKMFNYHNHCLTLVQFFGLTYPTALNTFCVESALLKINNKIDV